MVNLRKEYRSTDLQLGRFFPFSLQKLLSRCQEYFRNFGYFFQEHGNPASLQTQKGVFRTNCIDCLDRTNVVQSLLAKENLKAVLVRMGVIGPEANLEDQRNFQVRTTAFLRTLFKLFSSSHFSLDSL